MKYNFLARSDFGNCSYTDETVKFVSKNSADDASFFLDVDFPDWQEDCYILIPACAYNGNRFKMVTRPYPPMYLKDEVGKNAEHQIMRGIPSLGKDGNGKLDFMTSFIRPSGLITTVIYAGEEEWLKYAKVAANLFSSWVMTYKFKFPEDKEFARLDINTVGSVFANAQNKHSAPGICTFSGDTLYRLYKYTGNDAYLELIKDVAYFMPQCVSTDERPIYDWDHKYGDLNGRLPAGYICERVNTSDWEYDRCVGGVFNVSCWCETSVILTFLELMDKPEMK